MKHGIGKRAFAILLALLLILIFGCIKRDPNAAGAGQSEIVTLDTLVDTGSDAAEHLGAHVVNGDTSEETGGSFASADPDENTLLVENRGSLTLSGASIDKVGDATKSLSSGQNAAVAATTGSQCALVDCVVTANALGGIGLYASGSVTLLSASACYIMTSGASSAGLCAADGGSVTLAGGSVATEGTDSPCLLLSGGGTISLAGVSLSASGSDLIAVLSGECKLLASGQALSGAVSVADGATLLLALQDGSAFTGAFPAGPPARASVSLDASSTWTLTADCYVTTFVNADAMHQNIISNGFSIYYDSNAPENAALGGQSFLLPGGGFLAPLI